LVLLGCAGAEERPETQKPTPNTQAAEPKTKEAQGRGVRRQDKDYADAVLEGGTGGGGATP
jgi:hypothetical protein